MPPPVIFLCFANPREEGVANLRNLALEAAGIRAMLESTGGQSLCEVVFEPNATVPRILDVFSDARYRNRIAIFHYGGHAGSAELLLENKAGEGARANAEGLAAFLGQQQGIQLVFLNGCSTVLQVEGLIKAGVASVIATSKAIDDAVATDFAIRFYTSLVGGASLRTAYNEAVAEARINHGGSTRDLYPAEIDGKPVPQELTAVWPWSLNPPEAVDQVMSWNLPDAVGDPLYGLPALPEMDLPEAPFRNINWFRREDAPIFFGRGAEIRELYQKITASDGNPVILYYGQSGVGKSSLLAAGLLPRLDQVQQVAYVRRMETLGLCGALLAALQAHAAHLEVAEAGHDAATLWHAIEAHAGTPLTVILDQVEEAYTRPRADEPDEMEQLIENLAAIFRERATRPQGRIVLSFRKEWLAEVVKLLQSRQAPHSSVFLQRLRRGGVIEAITGPARTERLRNQYNLTVEDGLADQIASDLLEDTSGAVAPTLQILLHKMFLRAKSVSNSQPQFTAALYDELKRKGLLLEDFLREQMQALDAAQHALVASGLALDLLAFHTTPLGTAEERNYTSVRETYAQREAELPALLQACSDLYLLVDPSTDTPEAERATRLAHDTLAPLVRQRYEHSDAPGQRARRIVENRGVEWRDGKPGATLDDDDLALVEAGRDGMRVLTADEQRMLEASRKEIDERLASEAQKERERAEAKAAQEQALLKEAAATARADQQQKGKRTARLMAALAVLLAAIAGYSWYRTYGLNINLETANTNLTAQGQALARTNTELGTANKEVERANVQLSDAKQRIEDLNRAIRADQLSLTALELVDEDPPLALLLGVESLREQNDILRNEPAVLSRITYDFTSAAYVTSTSVLTREAVSGGAIGRTYRLLRQIRGKPLTGHTGPVTAIAFSPDGRQIATGSYDNTARLWDLSTADPGTAPVVLTGHKDWVTAIAFSPDGHWLATGSYDNTARLWDLSAADPGAAPVVLTGHTERITDIAFSPDGHWLATGSWDATARLWDLSAADPGTAPVVLTGHTEQITAIAFSPDGRRLATGSWDATARLWDLSVADPGAAPVVLTGHTGPVFAIAFSPDGRRLATGSDDDTARLWDLDAADPSGESVVLTGHRGPVYAVAFSPDGRRLATGSHDNTARLWDLDAADPGAEPMLLAGHAGTVEAVAFSSDGRWFATGSWDATVRLWDLRVEDPTAGPMILMGHAGWIQSVTFSPDGRRLATGSWDDTARLWNLDATDPNVDSVILSGSTGWAESVAFSSDGRWLATGAGGNRVMIQSLDNTARLWNLDADDPGTNPIVLAGHTAQINAVAFSPDGHWLATGAGGIPIIIQSLDNSARLWDLTAADLSANPIVLTGHAGPINAIAFSPNGRRLATGSWDATARLWDLSAVDPGAAPVVLTGHTEQITAIAFSPDGRRLATGSYDNTARLWDLGADDPNAAPVVLTGHTGPVFAIAFSPDGRRLATGSYDNTARLWDLDAADPGAAPVVLTGHTGPVYAVAFSPDGRWLTTGSSDTTARLWDLSAADPTEAPIVWAGYEDSVLSVTFSPDGRWLATGSDGVALTPLREADELIWLACQRTGRNLTPVEWRSYLGNQPDRPYRATCPQWPFPNESLAQTSS